MSLVQNVFSLAYPQKEGRIVLLDFIRGFAMLLVILQHSEIPGQQYLLAFHMPLFFFLSGFVSGNRKNACFFKYLSTRFRRLMIPYLSFGILFIVAYYFLSLIMGVDYDVLYALLGMVTGQYGFVNPFLSGIYWFLITLFVADLLTYPFCKLADSHEQIQLFIILGGAVLFILLSYITTHGNPITLFTIDKSFMAAAFILIGRACKPLSSYILNCRIGLYDCILAIMGCFFLYISVSKNNQEVLMYINQYGDYGWFFLGSFAGIVVSLLIAKIVEKELSSSGLVYIFLLWAGYNSLVLFPVHVTLLLLLRLSGFYSLIGIDNFLIHFSIVLILCMPISNIISNYLPWMLGDFK